MASPKVNVTVSPVSALPTVPPDAFAVWTFEPPGAEPSTTTLKLTAPLELPATSSAVTV